MSKIAFESALENHTALKLHIREMTSKDCYMQGENPLQLPMDSREGSIVSPIPKTRICQGRTGRLQSYFTVHCAQPGLS